jgi:hypothetical protein
VRRLRRLLPRVLAGAFVATAHFYLPRGLALVLAGIVLIRLALDELPADNSPGSQGREEPGEALPRTRDLPAGRFLEEPLRRITARHPSLRVAR